MMIGRSILVAIMMLFATMFSSQSAAQDNLTGKYTGMLILGSDDSQTLEERVRVAYNLYNSEISFDYIIVSGGCAAHKSNICEASEMARLLEEMGVPTEKIYKEEKSKSTVQNYCYSRELEKRDGSKVINPGDKLYVVSNHWHAIPVAARFTANDGVDASYHIEGGIVPKNKDKVNYTNIYSVLASDNYCKAALWPMVNASYSIGGEEEDNATYNFLDDILYVDRDPKNISEGIPALPAAWREGIDAAFYNGREKKVYLFKGSDVVRYSPDTKKTDEDFPKPIKRWLKEMPENWRDKPIDAAFYNPGDKEIILFKGEDYLRLSAKSGKIRQVQKISSFMDNWPFEWGSGEIDAANFNKEENKLYLFRGKKFVKVAVDKNAATVESGYPQGTKLEWPEAILGKK